MKNIQETFDEVANHLIQQGKQSQSDIFHGCAYRSKDGLACAVGCLIDDKFYTEDIEGTVLGSTHDRLRAKKIDYLLIKSGVNVKDERIKRMLCDLQQLHDGWEQVYDDDFITWIKDGLPQIAKDFDLEYPKETL